MSAHYVYRCMDHTGRLLYVGCTQDLGKRLDSHLREAWWALDVTKVQAVIRPSKATGRAPEIQVIRAEKPRWNIVGKGPSRLMSTVDEYRDYYKAIVSYPKTAFYHVSRIERECRERFGVDLAIDLAQKDAA